MLQTESVNSTVSLGEEFFPSQIGLVGDDFMRNFLSFELYGADFTNQNGKTNHIAFEISGYGQLIEPNAIYSLFTDKRFGYCISGQSVRHAYNLILDEQNHFTSKYRYIIINVGAIDILQGEELVNIQVSYARLVKAIDMIGCQPIITTIPDLRVSPNNPNKKIIRQTLLLLNRFLVETYGDGYPVIDLYSALPRMEINGTNQNYYYHK